MVKGVVRCVVEMWVAAGAWCVGCQKYEILPCQRKYRM